MGRGDGHGYDRGVDVSLCFVFQVLIESKKRYCKQAAPKLVSLSALSVLYFSEFENREILSISVSSSGIGAGTREDEYVAGGEEPLTNSSKTKPAAISIATAERTTSERTLCRRRACGEGGIGISAISDVDEDQLQRMVSADARQHGGTGILVCCGTG